MTDRWEIKCMKFYRSGSREMPWFNFKTWQMGSLCSYRIKFAPSHWQPGFASQRQENDPFLKRVITVYKKLVAYNSVKRKRWWSLKKKMNQFKAFTKQIFVKKDDAVCSVVFQWNLFFLVPTREQTIPWIILKCTVISVNDLLKNKRTDLINGKSIMFRYDNAKPHTRSVTR